MKIRFLNSAMQDMQEIKDFIAKDNPAAAKRLIQSFKKKTNQLVQHPYSGRVIPETKYSNLRELIVSNYRIMYQVSDSFVTVFAVYESHRQYIGDKNSSDE
ncbi:MAG: type II toxin-antitoxin system RelE/ParE family toxin [Deltaproteobacteria bacterium]|jgi:toxin ParE1/3/4|nr:type II toxin-antitoxin system RelE/ParE family toxin [Deltaproteobacteria bacterium]MBT4090088.1 type II toxin-antitoxin system RelE/ParE family toxin [Deltaproteobacteria bacterium]MBT4269752.1 type II toxin-antitoxin system RelE/ParE family toxin [Deltaproteobacteria bacterium]MBT4639269.1 type II toxin-antitoxin system RelE/ParE family toxin [Deltaproteobacteria bacterium]MBT6504115.1 type II toxin-antitoxin system RelE/ParE family toxin [Deltaproteobacteria bacterium]